VRAKRFVVCGVSTVILVGTALTAFGATASASFSGASPSTLVAHSIADAESESWVHEEMHASAKGHTLSMNNEIGAVDGQQVIRSDDATTEVKLVNGIAYIEANTKGVTEFFELSTTDPQQLAGKWFSVTSSQAGYSTYVASVTLSSDFGQLQLLAPLTEGSQTTMDGHSVIPVHGYATGTSKGSKVPATLYVTATGKALPLAYVISSKEAHETIRWSDWGHPVYLVVPGSVPLPNQ
jgi:hypothetical protein